jgi:hypothetical protein
LAGISAILETSIDYILGGGNKIMAFEKRVAVKDIQNGSPLFAIMQRNTQ